MIANILQLNFERDFEGLLFVYGLVLHCSKLITELFQFRAFLHFKLQDCKAISLLNQASHITQGVEDKKVTQSDCRLMERKKLASSCHLRKEKEKKKTVELFWARR